MKWFTDLTSDLTTESSVDFCDMINRQEHKRDMSSVIDEGHLESSFYPEGEWGVLQQLSLGIFFRFMFIADTPKHAAGSITAMSFDPLQELVWLGTEHVLNIKVSW